MLTHRDRPFDGISVRALSTLKRRRLGIVVAVVALALLAAVGWSAWRHSAGRPPVVAAPTAVSGVVEIEGGPPPPPGQSDVHPISSPLVVTGETAAGARLVRHLSADSHGRFAVKLPPGIYTVTALIFGSTTRSLASQPHAKVTVKRGHPVRVRIVSQIF